VTAAPERVPVPAAPRPPGRGLVGFVEEAWSGRPGSLPWTAALAPAAFLYGAL
jgi:hypothetical protein